MGFPFIPAAITALAILSAAAGVWLSSVHALSRPLVPFSGGVLMGMAIFWVLPEMSDDLTWPIATAWLAAGFLLLWVVDRFVYPVCPSCSHSHVHEHCAASLHGFALPTATAAALHSALDGWGVASAGGIANLGPLFVAGIAAHKVPEGIALGVILRAALDSRRSALLWCAAAEAATILGALIEGFAAPYLGTHGLYALLALAGGSFLYLGGHAVHGEWRRGGPKTAMLPAVAGIAGSSLLKFMLA